MSTSTETISSIVSLLPALSTARMPGLSQAAEAALKLQTAVQNRSSGDYQQVAADACQLVFVVADQLREKGQKNIDNGLKDNLESVARLFKEIQTLAQTPQNAFSAFYSDSNNFEDLEKKLQQSLGTFHFKNVAELRAQADRRIKTLIPSPPSVPSNINSNNNGNYGHGPGYTNQYGNGVNQRDNGVVQNNNGIAQRDGGTVYSGNQSGTHMFNQANGFKIDGGEFNNVGGSMNKTNFHGKNIATSYGTLQGQIVGDNGQVDFHGNPK